MPYSIETGRADCSGYAVVKDTDGALMGCHRTAAQAQDQITALNIAEAENRQEPDAPADTVHNNTRPNLEAARAILADIHRQH